MPISSMSSHPQSYKHTDSLSDAGRVQESAYRLLLERIAQGNEAALAEFYRAFESRIYAFIKIRLNDSHEAADLLNDIMWEIWRGAKSFQGRSSVSSWVFGIANHKAIDRARRIGKHQTEPLEATDLEISDADLDDILMQKQLAEHLQHCMDKLPPNHRQTVYLAFFEDLSYKEIGKIFGNPEGTIKARMFHAKRSLKRCLTWRIQ